MMNENNLNVYITTYNRADKLKNSIQAVLDQSFKDFDLYILDNCSTDNTKQVVEGFFDSRLHYIRHEENIGFIGNVNFAFKHNTKKYYVVFHDDDMMERDFLLTEYDYLENNSDVAAVACKARCVNEQGDIVEKQGNDSGEVKVFSERDLFNSYFECGHYLNFPTIMYRNSFVKLHNILLNKDVGPSCDVICYCDIERFGGKVGEIDKILISTGIHEEKLSVVTRAEMSMKLLLYIKNNEYYSVLLKKHPKGESHYVRKLFYNEACIVAGGYLSLEEGKYNINRYIDALNVKFIDILWINTFFICYRICPKFVNFVYSKGKSVKDK